MKPIILLDFTGQLRTHSFNLPREAEARIKAESYNEVLIELLKADAGKVILLSTRQGRWAPVTLETLRKKTAWTPTEAYWNDQNQEPAEMKARILEHYIFPRLGTPGTQNYIAVDGDPRSVAMYQGRGIESVTIYREDFTRLIRGEGHGRKKR